MIAQTPWVERKFDFSFPVGLFPIIIQRLSGTLMQLEAMIKNIPEERLCRKPDSKWSAKEVIGHLYDVEELWYGRIDDFLDHKETLRFADISNAKTTAANHNLKPVDNLLEQFAESRNKLIDRVKNFDEATLLLTALHPRLKIPMRLIDSLFFVAEHDDHEQTKISRLIKA